MIHEFAQWLENNTAWKIGVDLFISELPHPKRVDGTPVPERCILISDDGGAGLVGQLPDRADVEMQIWNRAKDEWTARADAVALFNRIHGRENIALPILTSGEEYLIMIATAVSRPAVIAKPNAEQLYEVSTNYILQMKDANE